MLGTGLKFGLNQEIFESPQEHPVAGIGWKNALDTLDVAFQSIVNLNSGQLFGIEVQARGWEQAGFSSLENLVGACADSGLVREFERAIRRCTAEKLKGHPCPADCRLFFSLDDRIGGEAEMLIEETRGLFKDFPGLIVTQIRTNGPDVEGIESWLRPVKKHGNLLALDHFGVAYNGMRLLAEADPDIIKIAPACIAGIDENTRKRALVGQIIMMAHTQGKLVVAVGVETERELAVCRDMGCNLAQGPIIQPPLDDTREIPAAYHRIVAPVSERPRRQADKTRILDYLDRAPPLDFNTSMNVVFQRLASDNERLYIPVVDSLGFALGIVRERDLRSIAYSIYGRELVTSRSHGKTLAKFIVRCPFADISTPVEQILAIYAGTDASDGVLIVDNLRYLGFLTADSILRATYELMVSRAREENPLTKLPGNDMINGFLSECLAGPGEAFFLYADLDNFKPFNDTYGFRQGDRAILLFAGLMREAARPESWFLGHIGGDDFFIGFRGLAREEVITVARTLLRRFAEDARSLYDAETRERGFIEAKDREGHVKTFPLLTASAVLVELPARHSGVTIEDISRHLAQSKKKAKTSPEKLAIAVLPSSPAPETAGGTLTPCPDASASPGYGI